MNKFISSLLFTLCITISGYAQEGIEIQEVSDTIARNIYAENNSASIEKELDNLANLQLPPLSTFLASVEEHPTVRIYDAKREEAEAELKVTRNKWLDYLRITGNYQYGKMVAINGFSDETTPLFYTSSGISRNQYSIGASLSIPLGDLVGGQKQTVKANKARLRQMEYEYATTVENRKLVILEAYNNVLQELATLKAKSEAAALYNAQMKISEQDFINGKIDIISLSLERSRRTGALVTYESGRVALHNAITLLELLTNVKIIKR